MEINEHFNSKRDPDCKVTIRITKLNVDPSTIKMVDRESFILKSNIIHSNFYQYDKSKYVNYRTALIITCPKHGDFEQSPDCHIRTKIPCKGCRYNKDSKGYSDIDPFDIDLSTVGTSSISIVNFDRSPKHK